MKEALAKINELVGILQQRIEFNNRISKENEERAAKLNEMQDGLDARAKKLAADEERLRPLGDAATAIQQAAEAGRENKEQRDALNRDKDAFNKYVSDTRSQMADERRQLNIDKDKVEKGNVLLQKEWIELNKKKESMKADIIQEVMKSQVK